MMRALDACARARGAGPIASPTIPASRLLEGAAILGDILTFYQEHYANEAYLRTAAVARERGGAGAAHGLSAWRRASAGARPWPSKRAATIPVTIREGFPVKADLADVPAPADFQTDAELIGVAASRPLQPVPQASVRGTRWPLAPRPWSLRAWTAPADAISLAAFELKVGDR